MTEQSLYVYLVGGILGAAIFFWLVYEMIKSATKEIKDNSAFQVKLLIELLKKEGVDKGTIDEILSSK